LHRHYDEAGRLTIEQYDFKSNVLEKAREVISDAAILAVFDPPPANWQVKAFRVDWQLECQPCLMQPISDFHRLRCLNRIKLMRYPRVDAQRKLKPQHNRAKHWKALNGRCTSNASPTMPKASARSLRMAMA
jgi:hypothetical protein